MFDSLFKQVDQLVLSDILAHLDELTDVDEFLLVGGWGPNLILHSLEGRVDVVHGFIGPFLNTLDQAVANLDRCGGESLLHLVGLNAEHGRVDEVI